MEKEEVKQLDPVERYWQNALDLPNLVPQYSDPP
jgi:hypothetical protein